MYSRGFCFRPPASLPGYEMHGHQSAEMLLWSQPQPLQTVRLTVSMFGHAPASTGDMKPVKDGQLVEVEQDTVQPYGQEHDCQNVQRQWHHENPA